ncbi:MAG: FAD-dependent oxidoreductase [Frankiales bacterium]|nr:FAD-dependent oxidoreductase [Frankiales bacterium]
MVVGAGIVGACCADALSAAGLRVCVVDRGGVVAGTTGAGEGNILVSDKEPGPELDLALLSRGLWAALADELPDAVELEAKGGLVVAAAPDDLASLLRVADAQRAHGVDTVPVAAADLPALEPHLATDLAGGVLYPQDMQVQPMLAAAHLLRRARARGAEVLTRTELVGLERTAAGSVAAALTTAGRLPCRWLVNAAGTWGGDVAGLAGAPVPVLPRRGFILVTEPLPPGTVRHKVYRADYVANVASGSAGLETSPVVESTRSGTVLIGASRERVGFDPTVSYDVLARLAAQALALFPVLASVRAQRAYRGFRPYCPDHLPVIGPDPRVDGVVHACGHEGAGIGLAPATARLVTEAVTGAPTTLPLDPFSPTRFAA